MYAPCMAMTGTALFILVSALFLEMGYQLRIRSQLGTTFHRKAIHTSVNALEPTIDIPCENGERFRTGAL
jgi:hypothetical protein